MLRLETSLVCGEGNINSLLKNAVYHQKLYLFIQEEVKGSFSDFFFLTGLKAGAGNPALPSWSPTGKPDLQERP